MRIRRRILNNKNVDGLFAQGPQDILLHAGQVLPGRRLYPDGHDDAGHDGVQTAVLQPWPVRGIPVVFLTGLFSDDEPEGGIRSR